MSQQVRCSGRARWLAWGLVLAASWAGAAEPGGNWDRPAFSIPAREVASLALEEQEADANVVVLRAEDRISYDSAGRRTYVRTILFKVLTSAGVDDWDGVGLEWSPWYQQRPVIRARVITADGAEHTLDPATIAESPAGDGDPDLYGDNRTLNAPLPALGIGCVVEEQTTVADREPRFAAGDAQTLFLDWSVPARLVRLTLEAPVALPLRWVVRGGSDVVETRSEDATAVHVAFQARNLKPAADLESGMPSDQPRGRAVTYSTGSSWQALATSYADQVKQRLDNSDVRSLVKAAGNPNLPVRVRIASIMAQLHRNVRYTGVEFGEAAILPQPPAVTLTRHFGDCKDQATLLVAALRAIGVDARLVLLRAGFGLDVELAHPGLGGFNHVIVVLADQSLWIDPTDRFSRVGQLPLGDQGRWALIVDPGTTALVRIPQSTSADNVDVETREFFLAEEGPARVIETTTPVGSRESSYRADYFGVDREATRKQLEKYVKLVYSAKELGTFTYSDAEDMDTRFVLSIEALKAGRGATDDSEAVAALLPAGLAQLLPSALTDEKAPPRLHDWCQFEPKTVEWTYRIHPPLGYVARPLPKAGTEKFGSISLTRDFSLGSDGTVTAVLRLDTGAARLTSVQFEETRKAIKKLGESEPIIIGFDQQAEADLAAGRIREALTGFRELVQTHPKRARHHSQIARTLLAGGLGEEARREARLAVEVEPSSALGWRTLGWVLEHDQVGRRFGHGFDRSTALNAYREAKKLDKDDATARASLAILLEHDEEGQRYARVSDLPAAIAEYNSLASELDNHGFDNNLLIAMLMARQFEQVVALAPTCKAASVREEILLAALAAKDGPAAAIEEARRRLSAGEARRAGVTRAARFLVDLREYPAAAAMWTEATAGAANASAMQPLLASLRQTRRWEELPMPPDEPASLMHRFLIEMFVGDGDLLGLCSQVARAEAENKMKEGMGVAELRRMIRGKLSAAGTSFASTADMLMASLKVITTGEATTGYFIRAKVSMGGNPQELAGIAIRENGGLRFLAFAPDFAAVGIEALHRLDAGDLRGARALLDWVRDEVPLGGGDDPLDDMPFPHLWTVGREGSVDTARDAAAALASGGFYSKETIPFLERDLPAIAPPENRVWVDLALARSLAHASRWADLERVADRLLAARPDSDAALMLRAAALSGQGQRERVVALAEFRLARKPGDPVGVRVLANERARQGKWSEAQALLLGLVERGKAIAVDFNQLAWQGLFTPPIDEQNLRWAEQAVDLTGGANHGTLHTRAAVLAEAGQCTEAYQTILTAMASDGRKEPAEVDWWVFGRMAEQYGLPEAARTLYGRVSQPKPEGPEPPELSTWMLAKSRIAALKPSPPGHAKAATGPR